MNFLRKHWYDLGGLMAIATAVYVVLVWPTLTPYQCILWIQLICLFMHQLEEYRIVATFPGMINKMVYRSNLPDRYPLNTNTALLVNVVTGWLLYLGAAVVAERAVWLGMATVAVTLGNIIAHTFYFNIKGRMFYNAGLATCLLLFVPCTYCFFSTVVHAHLASKADFIIGIALGMVINVVGILKTIEWMADKNTSYIFSDKHLLMADRRENGRVGI